MEKAHSELRLGALILRGCSPNPSGSLMPRLSDCPILLSWDAGLGERLQGQVWRGDSTHQFCDWWLPPSQAAGAGPGGPRPLWSARIKGGLSGVARAWLETWPIAGHRKASRPSNCRWPGATLPGSPPPGGNTLGSLGFRAHKTRAPGPGPLGLHASTSTQDC